MATLGRDSMEVKGGGEIDMVAYNFLKLHLCELLEYF
jgi:hypothetical protein